MRIPHWSYMTAVLLIGMLSLSACQTVPECEPPVQLHFDVVAVDSKGDSVAATAVSDTIPDAAIVHRLLNRRISTLCQYNEDRGWASGTTEYGVSLLDPRQLNLMRPCPCCPPMKYDSIGCCECPINLMAITSFTYGSDPFEVKKEFSGWLYCS